MKWFYGMYGNVSTKNKIILSEKVNLYYNRIFEYNTNNYEEEGLYYTEFFNSNSAKSEKIGDIIILGNMHLDYVPAEIRNGKDDKKTDFYYVYVLYMKYGSKFVEYLYGKFAFIIIDKRCNNIVLIRDQFGLEQLFYTQINDCFIFANNIFLLDNFYKGNEILTEYINKFIQYNGICNFNETPYANVFRVDMAHLITYSSSSGEINDNRYWNLVDIESDNTIKFEIAKVKFKEILNSSVTEKIKNKESLGIMLSGGLDSTVIYSIVYNKDIITYSAIFDKATSCDERYFINQTLKKLPCKISKYVISDDAGFFAGFPDSYFYTSEPHLNMINKQLSENLFDAAQEDNSKYILDGFLADHILSGNIIYILDKLKKIKNYASIFKEVESYAAINNESLRGVIKHDLIKAKTNDYFVPAIDDNITDINREVLSGAKKHTGKEILVQILSTIARNFGDLELAPRYGIEVLHPYVDRKLIEFLYSLPGNFIMRNGIPKYLVKEAFKLDIPEEIIDRVNKTQHVELSHKGIEENWGSIYECLKEGIITELRCIDFDKEKWNDLLNRFRSGEEFDDKLLIYITLEMWLSLITKKFGSIKFIN